MLSLIAVYKWIRITGATVAAVAVVVWIAERISDQPNLISDMIQNIFAHAHFAVLLLALTALSVFASQCF